MKISTEEAISIGIAFMEKLPKDYWYNDSPIEYISYLKIKIDDVESILKNAIRDYKLKGSLSPMVLNRAEEYLNQ